MSWLRLDDDFAQHPKVVRLARGDRWTWLEVLLYCARYRTEGHVPEAIGEAIRAATPAFLDRCHTVRLLDLNGDGYFVHDWREYNPKDPTAAIRQQRKRDRERDADRDADRDESVTERDEGVTRVRARAGSRARPVPSLAPTALGLGTEAQLDTPPTPPSSSQATPSSSAGDWVCPQCGPLSGKQYRDEAGQAEHMRNVHGVKPGEAGF